MRLSDIIKNLRGIFEFKRKNPIHLRNDSNLESNLKPLKVANKNTPIQISEDTVDVKGSLKVNGVDVSTEPDDDTDTGATDPFKFYIYSGQPVADATNVILKSIWTSSTMTPADASEVIVLNEELEVHVGANQRLYCFYKKDSTSGNQDLYFSAQISGYYTK